MKYSWCPEVLKNDLNSEFSIFAFSQFKDFLILKKFKFLN